jgi:Resolvase, N terminal domain
MPRANPMLVGYMRVSTSEQNLALQRDVLEGAGCERLYEDTCSGSVTERPGLARALDTLRPGIAIAWPKPPAPRGDHFELTAEHAPASFEPFHMLGKRRDLLAFGVSQSRTDALQDVIAHLRCGLSVVCCDTSGSVQL